MAGWTGKTVHVDLSSESVNVIRTDEKLIRSYLGGRGLGVRLLSELAAPDIDPLGPDQSSYFHFRTANRPCSHGFRSSSYIEITSNRHDIQLERRWRLWKRTEES